MKMALISAVGLCGLAHAAANESLIQSCYEFPKVRENLIINRQGDQRALRSDEAFSYTYTYRSRDKYRVSLATEDGKGSVDTYEKIENKERTFRGESIESVKHLAENFIASREAHACKQ